MITRVLNRRLPALTIAAVLTAAAGCGSSPASTAGASSAAASGAFPVMVMTANGAVHISKRPTSIVSVSPTATEMLYAIGAGHQVSAVDQDSDYPPQAPRTKLSYLNPNIEAIVARKPDLVVISNETPGGWPSASPGSPSRCLTCLRRTASAASMPNSTSLAEPPETWPGPNAR